MGQHTLPSKMSPILTVPSEMEAILLSSAYVSLFETDEEVDWGMPALVAVEENRVTPLDSGVTSLETNLLDILLQPAPQQPTSEESAPLQPQLDEKVVLLKGELEGGEPHVLQESLVSDMPVQQPTILQPKAITELGKAVPIYIPVARLWGAEKNPAHPMSSLLVVDHRGGVTADFRVGALQFLTQKQNLFKAGI
jgi:hypothetical protein